MTIFEREMLVQMLIEAFSKKDIQNIKNIFINKEKHDIQLNNGGNSQVNNDVKHQLKKTFWKMQSSGIRIVNQNQQLNFLTFRIAFYLCLYLIQKHNAKSQTKQSSKIIMMITASHNQPKYNGVKLSRVSPFQTFEENLLLKLDDFINTNNDNQNYQKQIRSKLQPLIFQASQKHQKTQKLPDIAVFIARDSRVTSEAVSQTAIQAIQLVNSFFDGLIHYIDIGEISTPTAFALSQHLSTHIQACSSFPKNQQIRQIVDTYFSQIVNNFRQMFTLIKKEKIQSPKIFMDFGNGVGGVQFAQRFLNQIKLIDPIYFKNITVKDSDFSNPNVQCGAQFVFHNFYTHLQAWKKRASNTNQIQQAIKTSVFLFQNNEYDQAYHFDGDCDRIVIELKQSQELFDGDNFNCLFSMFLKHVIDSITINLQSEPLTQNLTQIKKQKILYHLENLKIISVGNTSSNPGIQEKFNKQSIQFQMVSVGIVNLILKIQKQCKLSEFGGLGAFFQQNGHGNFYFDNRQIAKLSLSSCQIEANMVLCLNNMTKNNVKGYAMVDFLCFQLIKIYIGHSAIKNMQNKRVSYFHEDVIKSKYNLFQRKLVIQIKLDIQDLLVKKIVFQNQSNGNKQLKYPPQIVEFAQIINQNYKQSNLFIRASVTQPLLRATIKGDKTQCQKISDELNKFFIKWRQNILLKL